MKYAVIDKDFDTAYLYVTTPCADEPEAADAVHRFKISLDDGGGPHGHMTQGYRDNMLALLKELVDNANRIESRDEIRRSGEVGCSVKSKGSESSRTGCNLAPCR